MKSLKRIKEYWCKIINTKLQTEILWEKERQRNKTFFLKEQRTREENEEMLKNITKQRDKNKK